MPPKKKRILLTTAFTRHRGIVRKVNKTMLSGLKFIPRDQIDSARDDKSNKTAREEKSTRSRKGKDKKKKKTSGHSSSDEDLDRIKKGSRKKKWYSSGEDLPSSDDNESDSDGTKISKRKTDKEKRDKSKKKSRRRKENSSDELSDLEDRNNVKSRRDLHHKGDAGLSQSLNDRNIVRKEMGLEWMLRPKDGVERKSDPHSDLPSEPLVEEVKKGNSRELNPYLKDNGIGYPEDETREDDGRNHLLSTSVVGDGGASWRLKALKRAQEQAAREGRKLDAVVEERWGSLGKLTVSVASNSAAPSHAHLHAIKNRIRSQTGEQRSLPDDQNNIGKERSKGGSVHHSKMRVPKLHDSLSWGKRKSQNMSSEDAGIISSAMSSLNKFSNDGSFMSAFKDQKNVDSGPSVSSSVHERKVDANVMELEKPEKDNAIVRPTLSANQLAAKVMQLRMKGKHDEAEKLLKEAEENKEKNNSGGESSRPQGHGNTSRYTTQGIAVQKKRKEEDADMHLAQTIVQNKRYTSSFSGQADDEYDFDEGPTRKTRKKGGNDSQSTQRQYAGTRILTQQERCNFCFENPNRPRHLVVAIANFTYLMLPQWQPVVQGHCCILPMQHESSTRTVDNNVWDEIRNFKKCLIMMYAKQEKDVVFLETVMGLAQQRRHCLVECIPLPQGVARQAPLYFKKAIDEAESEWSQHNAKKLIDTSEKGLRGSIPKDFPYFHVEFGLKQGFVHVIDDESQFPNNFGLNVIRGMLKLPAEDMHRRRKHESVETQKQAVKSFVQDWEPFDWTKQL